MTNRQRVHGQSSLQIGSGVATADHPIFTTMPVADLSRSSSASVVFPQIAVGGAFSTRLVVVNSNASNAATGNVNLYQPDGSDMSVAWNGTLGNRFAYSVPAG